MSDSFVTLQMIGFSVHGIFQARILEWVAIFLLQGLFSIQGLNSSLLCLLHRRQILYLLGHQRISIMLDNTLIH